MEPKVCVLTRVLLGYILGQCQDMLSRAGMLYASYVHDMACPAISLTSHYFHWGVQSIQVGPGCSRMSARGR